MSTYPTREQALQDFFAAWEPDDRIEIVSLRNAAGRVLARPARSANTLPVCRSSAGDGIAVRSADFADGMPDYRTWVCGRDFVRADTGDDFSDDFDAVIRIEDVELADDGHLTYINPEVSVQAGTRVNPRGKQIRVGDRILERNLPLRAQDLAALALGGQTDVAVWRKPLVAFLPTGSELVSAGMVPERGKSIDTNSVFVEEALKELGAEPLMFPPTPDDPLLLEERLSQALWSADMVILNGGSSKGSEDYTCQLLGKKGTIIHHRIAAAPGMPLALGTIQNKPVIILPGPAVAAFYGMDWCVQACINRWLHIPAKRREVLRGRLMEDITTSPDMAILCMVNVVENNGEFLVFPTRNRVTRLAPILTTNALYVSPLGESHLPAGSTIDVELTRGREFIPVVEDPSARDMSYYLAIADGPYGPIFPVIAEDVIAHTHVTEGTLLDLGCGGGHVGREIMKRTSLNGIFVDICAQSIEATKEHAHADGFDGRCTFILSDVAHTGLPDACANLIVSRGSWAFWDDLYLAFQEIWRMLAPGGYACIGGGCTSDEVSRAMVERTKAWDPTWEKGQNERSQNSNIRWLLAAIDALEVPYQLIQEPGEHLRWVQLHKPETSITEETQR